MNDDDDVRCLDVSILKVHAQSQSLGINQSLMYNRVRLRVYSFVDGCKASPRPPYNHFKTPLILRHLSFEITQALLVIPL
jgi:hypothetical protein